MIVRRRQFLFGRGAMRGAGRLPFMEASALWASDWQRTDRACEIDLDPPEGLADLAIEGVRIVPGGPRPAHS